MKSATSLMSLILVFAFLHGLGVCNAASLPSNANATVDTTAVAKTDDDSLGDVFEDIRWFFDRLSIFCDMVEKMVPPEKAVVEAPQPSVGRTLQNGFKHFLVGLREISKSIVRVLSDKEVREYKQLSRATDFAHDMVKSVGEFFKSVRILVGSLFATYTFYVPEVLLTKCMGSYLILTYPNRPIYEYPILLINDIIETFRSPKEEEIPQTNNTTPSHRRLDNDSDLYDKNVEQNEILDEDMYEFHNTPISPSPELAVKVDSVTEGTENKVQTTLAVTQLTDAVPLEIPSWKKCIQMYATETIFRKLEFYFLRIE